MTSLPPVDLGSPKGIVDLLDRAARRNLACPLRRGSTVVLPPRGRVLMTGDLHDHSPNLQRILRLAALDDRPDDYLVLHEVIHGPHRTNGRDLSFRMLCREAALQLRYPGRVHGLLSNHELAQVRGEDILKAGGGSIEPFDAGLEFLLGDLAPAGREAMGRFIRSLPLAVRLPRGILCCHSLPSPFALPTFDPTVLDRVPTEADLSPAGPAYRMVWGRGHTDALAAQLGRAWNVRLFVMGHQPAEMGYEIEGASMLVLASDHDHGAALPIDLDREYDLGELIDSIVPLAAVRMR